MPDGGFAPLPLPLPHPVLCPSGGSAQGFRVSLWVTATGKSPAGVRNQPHFLPLQSLSCPLPAWEQKQRGAAHTHLPLSPTPRCNPLGHVRGASASFIHTCKSEKFLLSTCHSGFACGAGVNMLANAGDAGSIPG